MKDNIEIKVDATSAHELTIREGAALPPKEPRIVNIKGIISSPADFANNRNFEIEATKANVIANYTNRTIILNMDETNPYGGTITGALDMNPDLKSLGINENKTYDEKDLMRKLNFFGAYFKDRASHKKLLEKLQQFKAKVTQDFTNQDDYKGTVAIAKISKIEHDIPLEFELAIPLFTGGEKKTFKVDICVSVRDGGISFWFESVEMNELIVTGTESIFKDELERFTILGYIIIKQW